MGQAEQRAGLGGLVAQPGCGPGRPVVPGDRLDMQVTMLRHKRNIGWVAGVATVDGQFACSAELMFSIVSDPRMFGGDSTVLHI